MPLQPVAEAVDDAGAQRFVLDLFHRFGKESERQEIVEIEDSTGFTLYGTAAVRSGLARVAGAPR